MGEEMLSYSTRNMHDGLMTAAASHTIRFSSVPFARAHVHAQLLLRTFANIRGNCR